MSEPYVICRVDPRLVHATVVNAWVPAKNLQRIIVADATVAGDTRRRHIIEMAAREVQNVVFAAESEVAELVRDVDVNTMVLFSGLAAVERAVAAGFVPSTIHVGHLPEAPGRQEYLPAVFLGPDEVAAIQRIQSRGMVVTLQSLPDDEPVVIEGLGRSSVADDPAFAEGEFEIVNERGLHLRAAHVLAALCNRLPNHIEIGRDDNMVNAKSLLGLTALGAAAGTRLRVVVTGPGAGEALTALRDLFANGFQEGAPSRIGGGP